MSVVRLARYTEAKLLRPEVTAQGISTNLHLPVHEGQHRIAGATLSTVASNAENESAIFGQLTGQPIRTTHHMAQCVTYVGRASNLATNVLISVTVTRAVTPPAIRSKEAEPGNIW